MFTQASYTIMENSLEQLSVCVQLVGELDLSINVNISLNEGTATTEDYSNANGVVSFTFNNSLANMQCLEVDIEEDDILENDETFSVVLFSQDEVVNVINGSTVVTIQDSSELFIGFERILYTIIEGNQLEYCVVTLNGSLDEHFSLPLNIIVLNGQGN